MASSISLSPLSHLLLLLLLLFILSFTVSFSFLSSSSTSPLLHCNRHSLWPCLLFLLLLLLLFLLIIIIIIIIIIFAASKRYTVNQTNSETHFPYPSARKTQPVQTLTHLCFTPLPLIKRRFPYPFILSLPYCLPLMSLSPPSSRIALTD